MSENIHVGDIGTIFLVTIVDDDTGEVIDLTTATTKELIFERAIGTTFTVNAIFPPGGDGSDGQIQYTTVAGTLDMSGDWEVQGHVLGVGYENRSSIAAFEVLDNLD